MSWISHSILSVRQVDDAVFAAVERDISLFGHLNSGFEKAFEEGRADGPYIFVKDRAGELLVKNFRRLPVLLQRLRVADAEIGRHQIDPVGSLMCEDQGLIAVECVSDPAIGRVREPRNGGHCVVENAAKDDPGLRRVLPDHVDRFQRDAVPEVLGPPA